MRKLFLEMGNYAKGDSEERSKDLIFVSRLYSRFIADFKITNLRKITIDMTDVYGDKTMITGVNRLSPVCIINKAFNWEDYETEAEQIARYKVLLDFMHGAVLEAAERFEWPKELFEKAYAESLATGFTNEYVIVRPKSSKDRRHVASVLARHSRDYVAIIVELKNKKDESETNQIELMKVNFGEDVFSGIVHKIKWVSNGDLVISNKDEEINFRMSVQDGNAEMFLTPRIHSQEYLQDELKILDPDVPKEEKLWILQQRLMDLTGGLA